MVVTDTHYLNVLEIMNRNEQQLYRDISNLTKALEKLVKVLTKLAKDQHLVRLHIGLEDPSDLIADIKQALKHLK